MSDGDSADGCLMAIALYGGALVGAVVGGLVGYDSEGALGAVVGGLAGGFAGAILGYLSLVVLSLGLALFLIVGPFAAIAALIYYLVAIR